jgi:hypothetical protein
MGCSPLGEPSRGFFCREIQVKLKLDTPKTTPNFGFSGVFQIAFLAYLHRSFRLDE